MKTIAIVAAAAAALFSTSALAQDGGMGLYGSAGVANVEVEGANLATVTGRIGARFIPQFGIEAEGSMGVSSDEIGADELSLKHDLAAFVVGALPITENVSLFARAGYGNTKVELDDGTTTAETDFNSSRYGIGGEFLFDDANGVRIDFTRIDADDGIDANMFSVSYIRRFR